METTNRTTLIVIIIAVVIVLIGMLIYRGGHPAVPANSQTGAMGNATGTSTMNTATTTTIVQPDGTTITVPAAGFDQKG